MSQPRTLTIPLFRTSLRSWQAAFKARKAEAGVPLDEAPRVVNQSRQKRAGRRKRPTRPVAGVQG
jgi:hypothetical protein